MEKINTHGYVHNPSNKLGKGKPVIRIKNIAGIRYKYTHVKGDLNPIIISERMGFGGYVLKLSIGLELFERFAR